MTFPRLSRSPKKNFPRPFTSPRMFKYKEKRHLGLLTIFRCSPLQKNWALIKHNVEVSCSEFRRIYLHMVSIVSTWTTRKCMTFKDFFSQDFPGPKWFFKTLQVIDFSRKHPELSRRCGNPVGYFTDRNWTIAVLKTEISTAVVKNRWTRVTEARSVITNLVGGTGHILEVNSWLLEALGRRAVQVDGTQRRFISTHVRWILRRQTDLSENLRQHDQQNAADALWCIWLNAYDPAKYFCFGYCRWGSGCQVDRRIRTGHVQLLCQLNE